jgi:hypothetical protein
MNHDSGIGYRKCFMSVAVELAGRIAHPFIPAIALMAMLSTLSFAQMLIPVDARMPAPDAFDFRGTWRCEGRLDSATLEVGTHHPNRWKRSKGHTDRDDLHWTALTEKGSAFTGHYWVAYDRDKKQFVMVDADDPAYAAYTIDEWKNETLVLTSFTAAQPSGWHFRWVYELHGVDQFKVSFETEDAMTWTTQSTCVCQRISPRG